MRTNGVRALGALMAALALMGVTACSSGGDPLTGSGTGPEPSASGSTAATPSDSPSATPPPPAPVVMAANVADKATKVTVDTLVQVTAKAGTLTQVKVTY